MSAPKLAATVLLCKPIKNHASKYSDFKILMVKRSMKSRFLPGAHVFPGGILEDADSDNAWVTVCGKSTSASKDFNLRLGGIRELYEETNTLLTSPRVKPVPEWRSKVQKDAKEFISLMREHKTVPDVDKLHPWARWITPIQEKWRYDTHFYIAVDDVQEGERDSVHQDNVETVSFDWFHPQEVLEKWNEKSVSIAPPTWFILMEICQYKTLKELLAAAPKRDFRSVQPNLTFQESGISVCMPGDADHPDTSNLGKLNFHMRTLQVDEQFFRPAST
jgi:nucleoside diphosphate-linked moiety X motif protein 19